MQSNTELSICNHMRKILSTILTKTLMVSLVCLCVFAGNEDENRKHLFIEVSRRCGPQKLSVHCGPYKRIMCWRNSNYV